MEQGISLFTWFLAGLPKARVIGAWGIFFDVPPCVKLRDRWDITRDIVAVDMVRGVWNRS